MAVSGGYSSDEECRRALRAEAHFFRPDRVGKARESTLREVLEGLSRCMIESRLRDSKTSPLLAGIGARLLVAAESSAVEATWREEKTAPLETVAIGTRDYMGTPKGLRAARTVFISYLQGLGSKEFVEGFPTSGVLHKGNCLLQGLGTYPEIARNLLQLFMRDCPPGADAEAKTAHCAAKERHIASLLLSFSAKIYAIDAETLFSDSEGKLHIMREAFPLLGLADYEFLTRMAYLLCVKEVARRRNPTDSARDLPWGTTFFRALALAAKGKIAFLDILCLPPGERGSAQFEGDSPEDYGGEYGPFTGRRLNGGGEGVPDRFPQVVFKMKRINRLYLREFGKTVSDKKGAWERVSLACTSYPALHTDLRKWLGDADSDGEAFQELAGARSARKPAAKKGSDGTHSISDGEGREREKRAKDPKILEAAKRGDLELIRTLSKTAENRTLSTVLVKLAGHGHARLIRPFWTEFKDRMEEWGRNAGVGFAFSHACRNKRKEALYALWNLEEARPLICQSLHKTLLFYSVDGQAFHNTQDVKTEVPQGLLTLFECEISEVLEILHPFLEEAIRKATDKGFAGVVGYLKRHRPPRPPGGGAASGAGAP